MKNYVVIQHHSNIYEIQNFLTDQEQDFFFKIITSSKEDDWPVLDNSLWSQKMLFLLDKNTSSVDQDKMAVIGYSLESRLTELFVHTTLVGTISTLQKYLVSDTTEYQDALGVHRDDVGGDDIRFGAVIYINDNYQGGEVYYPELDLEIKPKAKSLLVHRGNIPHGVKSIIGGDNKYILTSFIRGGTDVAIHL